MTDADNPPPFPFSDLALARRLERAEGHGNAAFVEARASMFPDVGAEWIEAAGAYCMFDGVESPCTQTFGLGLFEPVTADTLYVIEEFFHKHGAPVFHEVSPMADMALPLLLGERGYLPIELTSVLYRPVPTAADPSIQNEQIQVRLIDDGERESWARTSARGWSEFSEHTGFIYDLGIVSASTPNALPFVAEMDGHAIATGMMRIHEGVAVLAGASTSPEARNQGAQLALLDARLRYAAQHGCDIAMMGALPGSGSQRNAERHGFRIAYTRIKWSSKPFS